MTDSEASAHQDDSDEDIYKDFPEFSLEEELAKLEGSKEIYKKEALDLSEKIKVLTDENVELKKLNEVLGKNLSTLLKTAQAEICRKDSIIEELRSKVDSFTFRRCNKLGKDKYTTTEDLEPVNIRSEYSNVKSECLECKNNRNKKRSKSYENRTSSESESRSSKDDKKKSERDCTKESKDCDTDKRLSHFRENIKLRHSGSDHDGLMEKHRGSQFRRYSRRESIVGRRSYRQDERHHSKYDSVDKRGHGKRSNEPRFSLTRRDSGDRRSNRREDSQEKSRRSDAKRNRSRSRDRSPGRKESSSDKGRSRNSLESDPIIKNREHVRNKSRESESVRNSIKSDESKCSERSKSRAGVSNKSKQVPKDKSSVKNEVRRNSNTFDSKSPLEALYNEMVATRSSNRFSNPKSGVTKPDSELEEGEFVEDEQHNSENSDTSEEWTVTPQTQRPMTLYSKRMMEKISAEQSLPKDKEPKEETKSDTVEVKEDLKVDKKTEPMEVDKEPGELTDDENLVESSKEFQEIAKVASSVDNKINKKPAKGEWKKNPEPERLFKEPFKLETSSKMEGVKNETKTNTKSMVAPSETGDSISNCLISATKEIRDIIEFSPFKNNYKLIEISPVKPSSSEHVLDFYNKRLPSNAQTQKEVESKIFNLLVSLSGVPLDSNSTVEKAVTEENECQESKKEISTTEEHKPSPIEKNESGKKISGKEKADEKGSRKVNSRRSSKSKQTKIQEKQEDKTKKKSPREEDEVMETVTPGETTQFLDFFLRTTSPSKPIVPAEQENENRKLENDELGSPEKKSETNGSSSTTIDTSGEKESLNGSQSESQGKRTRSRTKSPRSVSSKSKKVKSPSKKRSSSSKESPKEKRTEERRREKTVESKNKKEKKSKSEELHKSDHKTRSRDEVSRGHSKSKADKKEQNKDTKVERNQKRKRSISERTETKKQKLEDSETGHKKVRSDLDSKIEPEEKEKETIKEDITSFEFFKPITKPEKSADEDENNSGDYKMTTTTRMSLTGVVCLETPNKCEGELKNLVINESAMYHILDSKNNTSGSPLISSKYPEMTPRRILKNDLMLTDSDDSMKKHNPDEDEMEDDDEEEEEAEVEMSENENSDFDSDSGASDFVDLL